MEESNRWVGLRKCRSIHSTTEVVCLFDAAIDQTAGGIDLYKADYDINHLTFRGDPVRFVIRPLATHELKLIGQGVAHLPKTVRSELFMMEVFRMAVIEIKGHAIEDNEGKEYRFTPQYDILPGQRRRMTDTSAASFPEEVQIDVASMALALSKWEERLGKRS